MKLGCDASISYPYFVCVCPNPNPLAFPRGCYGLRWSTREHALTYPLTLQLPDPNKASIWVNGIFSFTTTMCEPDEFHDVNGIWFYAQAIA